MSADTATLDIIQRVTTAGGLAYGTLGVLTPRLVNATYGMGDGGPSTVFMTRLWGGTLAGLAVLTLSTPPGERRRQLMLTMAATNAVNSVTPLMTEGLSTRTKVSAALTSGFFAAISAYGATLSD